MNNFLLVRIGLLILCLFQNISCTICRDGSSCPGVSTCCLTSHGVGCCPYQDANCCGDGIHCCPHGYQCGEGRCYLEKETIEAKELSPSLVKLVLDEDQFSLEKEIYYIINQCIVRREDESEMLDMLKNCKEKSEDYQASQNCRLALLYFQFRRQFKSSGCFDRLKKLIRRLEI
jgi:hypothetical protein